MARKTGGGSATAGGMDYQHRVAAWATVHILAEKAGNPPWDLPTETTLEWLQCETDQPVDDLMVGTSEKGLAFGQAKHTLQLSEDASSDLASALDQFVRQFIACRTKITGKQDWNRPLDPKRDRLLLVTSSMSSAPIRTRLPLVLKKIRDLRADQKLEDAIANEEERRAISTVINHITRSWQQASSTVPTSDEIRQVLSLFHVWVLDSDEGGSGESESKTLLRTSILQNPDQADLAWAQLIGLCAGFAAHHSGAGRPVLQAALLNKDVQIKVPQSYQSDIEKLKQYTNTTIEALAHLAEIRIGSTRLKIKRKAVEILQQEIEGGSILVIGEPGAGKSGALYELVQALKTDSRDFIFLAVDRVAAESLQQLRSEINLNHDLTETLENWPGLQPAFLVIDALDAARGEPAGTMIRDLMRIIAQKNGRWRVVVSIRKFDLRYSLEIKELFAGVPQTELLDGEFGDVRHLNIPRLQEDELDQIGSQSPELRALITGAPVELHGLLLTPFNLRVIAELLGTGISTQELTPIKTQFQLLEKYWNYRVISGDRQGDAREALLRKACQRMVEGRVLYVNRSEIADPASSIYLDTLLSSQVMVEWQHHPDAPPDRYTLAFSHNVLFDYAVARLLLRGPGDVVIKQMAADPELAIVIRPSLVHHFHYLWTIDSRRGQFWDSVFRMIGTEQAPEIGKLIGPSVAAGLTIDLQDLEYLANALDDSNPEIYLPAEKALQHLFGALLAEVPEDIRLVGVNAGPWCKLLEKISRSLRPSLAYTIRWLLQAICEHPEKLTSEQRDAAGWTARRLMDFAWTQTQRHARLLIDALRYVCRTYESNPVTSAQLIRRLLEASRLAQYGFEEMPPLSREIERLIPIDAELIGEIYCAVFQYQESSNEPAPFGSSRIMPMTSNRRQEYEAALYQLSEIFPKFLSYAPETAVHTLILIMEAYVAQHHASISDQWQEETFDFNGSQARLRPDYSSSWDENYVYLHDETLKMLSAFQQYFEGLAGPNGDPEKLQKCVQIIITENRLAVLWRRLLLAGAHFPVTLGQKIRSLAWTIPILATFDTTAPAGAFIKTIFPTLEPSEQQRIERAILTIPDFVTADQHESAERKRDHLLMWLEDYHLFTSDAQKLLNDLKNKVLSGTPPAPFEGWSKSYDDDEWSLPEEGIHVAPEPDRQIFKVARLVKEFTDQHRGSLPTIEVALSIFASIQELYNTLKSSFEAGMMDERHRTLAWGHLAEACEQLANIKEIACEEPTGTFIKAILLEASHHTEPAYDPAQDAHFDEFPSWGGPSARIEAAQGIMHLARFTSYIMPDLLEAIERLSQDPVPAVRLQIASQVNVLNNTAPDKMWAIIEHLAQNEERRGILHHLIGGPFRRLGGTDPTRIVLLTKVIFGRVKDGPGAKNVRDSCVGTFVALYIWRNQPECADIVLEIGSNPAAYQNEAFQLSNHFRDSVTYGPTDLADTKQDDIRHRALDLLSRILRSAKEGIRKLEHQHSSLPFNEWPPQDQEVAQSLGRLVDHLGMEIYFASGAYNEKKGNDQTPTLQRSSTEQSSRFYREAGPILDLLAETGFPSVAHQLLQIFEFFVPLDPRGVFLRIGNVVRAGEPGGYQYESLAADLVVKLVERYLAEYRPLLRSDEESRKTLVDVLDIFVQAGWPSARRLVYRLDEIFR